MSPIILITVSGLLNFTALIMLIADLPSNGNFREFAILHHCLLTNTLATLEATTYEQQEAILLPESFTFTLAMK